MLPMLAMTALSGGLSLMSGIGGRNAAKKQARLQTAENDRVRDYNAQKSYETDVHNLNVAREALDTPVRRGVDIDAMMMDAERAGFNPVTWLNAGAMQAYGWETQPAEAFRMMLRTPNLISASTVAKIPDAMEIVGDAGQAALNTFRSEYAREDSQAFQREQLGYQLSAIQQSRSIPGFGSIPRETTSGGRSVRAGPLLAGADAGLFPKPNSALTHMDNAKIEQPEVTPSLFGRNSWWQNDVRWPNSDSVTGVYGEGADWSYGPMKFGNDWWMNTTRGVGLNRGAGIGYYDLMDMAVTGVAAINRNIIGPPRFTMPSINIDRAFRNPGAQPWLGSGM